VETNAGPRPEAIAPIVAGLKAGRQEIDGPRLRGVIPKGALIFV
jgi:hypothetical protein